MLMNLDPWLGSDIQNQNCNTVKPTIKLMILTINSMIPLYLMQFGGQNGGLPKNSHIIWKWQKQMHQL